ncbi:MAG: hypothetical protein U9O94_01420 [Nanoarchaeota archaeon]|nr:hypothetical protein [Nanoarchaeota archaeon]
MKKYIILILLLLSYPVYAGVVATQQVISNVHTVAQDDDPSYFWRDTTDDSAILLKLDAGDFTIERGTLTSFEDVDDWSSVATFMTLSVDNTMEIGASITLKHGDIQWNNGDAIDPKAVELQEIGAATYDDVQDWSNIAQSSGIISGFTITDSGGGEIDVAAGTGIIKSSTTSISQNLFFDYAGQTNQNILTDNSMNFIYIDYNSGTPIVKATVTRSNINQKDEIGIGRLYRSGTNLKILSGGVQIDNDTGRTYKRLGAVDGFIRASGASTTADAGGNDRIVTGSGSLYYGLTPLTVPGMDTTAGGGDTFTYLDNNGGTWESLAAQTTIDYAHYDDGDGTLGNIQANKYGIHWLYYCMGTEAYFLVYGTYGTDTLSDAGERNSPAALPDCLSNMGFLVAKIIVKQNGTDYHVFAPWETTMSGSGISDHGDLAGLTDDDHTQYVLDAGDTMTGTLTTLGRIFETESISSADTLDANNHVIFCSGTTTLTLPTAVGIAGTVYTIVHTDTNVCTIDGAGAETISGETTWEINNQYDSMSIISDNTNWLIY